MFLLKSPNGNNFIDNLLLRLLIWYTVMTVHLFRKFESKDNLFQKEEVSEMSNCLWILLVIVLNQILTLLGQKHYCWHLVLWHCGFFLGAEKYCESSSIFTSLSDIVVICGHDKGLVLIRFSGEHFFACDNFECGINITGWYTICCIGWWIRPTVMEIVTVQNIMIKMEKWAINMAFNFFVGIRYICFVLTSFI